MVKLKYMKYVLTFLMLISVAYAQEPAYTPMRLNYQFRGIKVDSLFLVPSFIDTTSANSSTMKNVAGAMIRTGNDFWMRNASTSAWLQNVNVGTGSTIGSLNSPDRINGTATGAVTADMDALPINFIQVKQFTIRDTTGVNGVFNVNMDDVILESEDLIASASDTLIINKGKITHITTGNKYEFKDFNNTFLQVDTSGGFQAGDITKDSLTFVISKQDQDIKFKSKNPMKWKEPVNSITSQVKTGRGVSGIDLSSVDYFAKLPGVYQITTATTNDFYLPDAALFEGQTVHVINIDGSDANLLSDGGAINDATSVNITSIKANRYYIFSSDGSNWWGMWMQP